MWGVFQNFSTTACLVGTILITWNWLIENRICFESARDQCTSKLAFRISECEKLFSRRIYVRLIMSLRIFILFSSNNLTFWFCDLFSSFSLLLLGLDGLPLSLGGSHIYIFWKMGTLEPRGQPHLHFLKNGFRTFERESVRETGGTSKNLFVNQKHQSINWNTNQIN